VRYEPRVWYNPELRSTNFLVPGLMGFILMITGVLSTALSVVREKERGTMEQLRVTSLRPGQLILGKALPYLGISLVASAVIIAAARLLFGVEVQGPYFALFVATLIYLVGALGFGLLVSSISDSQAMAFQLGTLTSMLPAIFLSGFIFPIHSMPLVLQWLTYAVPARYYLTVLRGIILKGAGLAPFGEPMLFLTIYAVLVLGLAYVRLSRTETPA
jgi:ABC-2 type transport system permease protein